MVVITLGQRLQSESAHPHLQRRVETGIEVFRNTDAPYLIFTGGQTNPDIQKAECEAMRDHALEHGVKPEEVLLDDNAQDTKGNGYFTRRIVDSVGISVETVYVVSSCFHTDRAKYIFSQCFGDEYRINTSHCIETDVSADTIACYRQRDREFFEPITPGDVDAIQRRFAERHDYYNWLPEPSNETD